MNGEGLNVRRVLMTADAVGGVWTYVMELANALAAAGAEVVLATMGPRPTADQRAHAESIPGLILEESAFKLEWMDDPWDDVARAGEWLLELNESFRPDVIHLNGYAHGAMTWRAPVVITGHSCVLSWWAAVKKEPAPARWQKYANEIRRGLQACHFVVAPSRAMLSSLESLYGPFRKSTVILNGRNPSAFRPAAKQPFVLAAGRLWDGAKNIRALERIARFLPWPVYVAGEDQHPCGSAVVLENVTLLGRLSSESLPQWFGRASLFALPARYEPFGLSVLEAALAGCALVLGDIASLREIWEGAALFVDPEDPTALADALQKLMAGSELRNGLARAARKRALALTPERMAARYVQVYAGLLAARRPDTVLGPCSMADSRPEACQSAGVQPKLMLGSQLET